MLVLFALNCALGLGLIGLAYLLKSRKLIHNETARKLVHFAHALVVAGWPVFFGYWFVIFGELVFLAAVVVAQEYRLFHQLRQIGRKTWGEFFFPIGVITLAVIAPPVWVFVAALLLLGLADGAAAIVGTRLKTKAYKVFGHKKTVGGSIAFLGVSALVMLTVLLIAPEVINVQKFWLVVLGIPLAATIVENISPYGSDNFTVPLVVYFGVASLGLLG
jgi:phytol kinase